MQTLESEMAWITFTTVGAAALVLSVGNAGAVDDIFFHAGFCIIAARCTYDWRNK